MTPTRQTIRLGVIDDDSGFVTVLLKRAETAGWQHRDLAGPVPIEDLVAMKLNAIVIEPLVLGREPGNDYGDQPLEHVADEREHGGPLARGPEHVRRTYVPAADISHVHAQGPPDQVPGRHRAQNVAEQHEKNPQHGAESIAERWILGRHLRTPEHAALPNTKSVNMPP